MKSIGANTTGFKKKLADWAKDIGLRGNMALEKRWVMRSWRRIYTVLTIKACKFHADESSTQIHVQQIRGRFMQMLTCIDNCLKSTIYTCISMLFKPLTNFYKYNSSLIDVYLGYWQTFKHCSPNVYCPYNHRPVISQDFSWYQDFLQISLCINIFLNGEKYSPDKDRSRLYCFQTSSLLYVGMWRVCKSFKN